MLIRLLIILLLISAFLIFEVWGLEWSVESDFEYVKARTKETQVQLERDRFIDTLLNSVAEIRDKFKIKFGDTVFQEAANDPKLWSEIIRDPDMKDFFLLIILEEGGQDLKTIIASSDAKSLSNALEYLIGLFLAKYIEEDEQYLYDLVTPYRNRYFGIVLDSEEKIRCEIKDTFGDDVFKLAAEDPELRYDIINDIGVKYLLLRAISEVGDQDWKDLVRNNPTHVDFILGKLIAPLLTKFILQEELLKPKKRSKI